MAKTSVLVIDNCHSRFGASDISNIVTKLNEQYVSSGHYNGQYDALFDPSVVAMEAGVASWWRRQRGQIESHDDCQMSGQAFESVVEVKGFN